jgi:hypothetical protein
MPTSAEFVLAHLKDAVHRAFEEVTDVESYLVQVIRTEMAHLEGHEFVLRDTETGEEIGRCTLDPDGYSVESKGPGAVEVRMRMPIL